MKVRMMQEKTDVMDIGQIVSDFGFPIVAAVGMGYFIYYIWIWTTKEVKPVIGSASKTLIKLVDRIRMLDNDMIRLNTKLQMVLEYQKKSGINHDSDIEEFLAKNASTSAEFNQSSDREK
jgi:hypothetical protein